MSDRLDASDIARSLAERIEVLCAQLLPGARRDGRLLRCGSLSGEEGQSLVIALSGLKRGRWFEFNGHVGGDALDLVAKNKFGGDIAEAIRWSRDWLGLGQIDEAELARQRERARLAAERRDRDASAERRRKAQDAKALWLAGAPLSPGDVVWRYLSGRGIELEALPRLPGAIRCHPRLTHHKTASQWPAMVAAISGPDGAHLATQRTWLSPQNNGEVKKAPLGHDAKMSLGPFRHAGGAIHLTRGASGKPWRQAEEGEWVAFAEGIEDALTFGCARPDLRVAACGTSLAYLAHVALPLGCAGVILVAQNDPKGSDAMKAQGRGIAGLRARGYRVSVLRPPVFVKDINDWAQWLRSRPQEEEA